MAETVLIGLLSNEISTEVLFDWILSENHRVILVKSALNPI